MDPPVVRRCQAPSDAADPPRAASSCCLLVFDGQRQHSTLEGTHKLLACEAFLSHLIISHLTSSHLIPSSLAYVPTSSHHKNEEATYVCTCGHKKHAQTYLLCSCSSSMTPPSFPFPKTHTYTRHHHYHQFLCWCNPQLYVLCAQSHGWPCKYGLGRLTGFLTLPSAHVFYALPVHRATACIQCSTWPGASAHHCCGSKGMRCRCGFVECERGDQL